MNSKLNRSIADLASKIMREQPAKLPEPTPPLESDMVARVAASGMYSKFTHIKESLKMPKKKVSEEEKTSTSSAQDGNAAFSEGNFEALQSDYAAKLPAPTQTTTIKKKKVK
ncbi:hypothetical protein UFOVP49_133 [uncultured Caudovirales phage]|uniref:Uncharacterized protein n=1 Tax=uncultured Caudovirales phage TaxID=2100421 RepID=A0A6J5KT43_9CAUD|nr:hypothetical protein UFOVP49_133 [uncultured Caudovirales phage]